MHNSFAANNEAWSGVTSVSALTSDLYYHYYKETDLWRLSGDTVSTASGPIIENSITTAITVTPSATTVHSTGTQQITVVNQDGTNVVPECLFVSSTPAVATVSSTGLITSVITGTTTITVTHNDGPTGSTLVTSYWAGPLTITPLTFSGYTGQTVSLTAMASGHDVTTTSTWSASNTGSTVGASTGVVTLGPVSVTTLSQVTQISATYGSLTNTGGNSYITDYYWVTSLTMTPTGWTGTTTGQTQQLTIVNQAGTNIPISTTSFTSITSSNTGVTVSDTGLMTIAPTATSGTVIITATYRPIPSITATKTYAIVIT